MSFQTAVGTQMAPGIEGGFSGNQPTFTLTNPDEAMWVVGTAGAIIGQFAWADMLTGKASSAHSGGAQVRPGFVHRDQQVYISGLLLSASLAMSAGMPVDMFEDAPMWARFAAGATAGQKVYASYATGAVRSAVTGAPATATGVTWTQNNSVNVTVVAGGTLVPGQPVSGTGIPAGTYVVSYNAGAATAVLSAATTGGAASGNAVTQTTDFETSWSVRSNCLSGELAKISVRG